jgi:transcriptional regulator with XRE-family HTH domain
MSGGDYKRAGSFATKSLASPISKPLCKVETVQTTYGERLKRAREHAELSQAELGRRIGKSAQTIQYLEEPKNAAQGSKSSPRLAQECGVDPVWLSTGDGQMIPSGVREPPARYDVRPADLAKQVRSMRPEVRQALIVLISALSHSQTGRTFSLSSSMDLQERKVTSRRARRRSF